MSEYADQIKHIVDSLAAYEPYRGAKVIGNLLSSLTPLVTMLDDIHCVSDDNLHEALDKVLSGITTQLEDFPRREEDYFDFVAPDLDARWRVAQRDGEEYAVVFVEGHKWPILVIGPTKTLPCGTDTASFYSMAADALYRFDSLAHETLKQECIQRSGVAVWHEINVVIPEYVCAVFIDRHGLGYPQIVEPGQSPEDDNDRLFGVYRDYTQARKTYEQLQKEILE